ncbi:MAG: SidA/IucD/PvdA family monooxygenase [Solirubrobacterales bacterium]|nr:SidA/IucD/PvdA family monooxygenase [Solirubrobacterales bacterium]
MAIGSSSRLNGEWPHYEFVGVGFGPAGIALAVAIDDAEEDRRDEPPWRALFLEEATDSRWQPEMLLPGTDIQHHFLRDFATPRNPRSRYTFPNYLKEAGRLFAFGLLGGSPGRIEWADYCQWVARQVAGRALYRHRVTSIEPVIGADRRHVDLLQVNALDLEGGGPVTFLAANVVLCSGRKPQVPSVFEPCLGPRVFHSRYFLSRIAGLDPMTGPTIAVIGSGQNAIEILLHLIDRFPRSTIYSINRNSGFRLYDLGHFSNQVYWPAEVDYFYWLSKSARRKVLEEVRFTNYASVDADVSRALYWRIYEDSILGRNRVTVIKRSAVTRIAETRSQLELVVEDVYSGEERRVGADAVVLCTGFLDEPVPYLLERLRPYLVLDTDGDLCVTRDYAVRTTAQMRAGLFINGLTELSHGISDAASFSMMALKAERTLERLSATRRSQLDGRRQAVETVA